MSAIPYQQSPLRRLRRLARWLAACGGAPDCAVHYWRREHELDDECNRLLGAEIEWACKTAAESFGFDWLWLEDEPKPAAQLPEALRNDPLDFCDRSKSEDVLDRYDVDQGTSADSSPLSEPSSPLSQVTAAEVAQALRNLLDSSKRDVDACDEVRCLVPEQDTEWPKDYDLDALEAAHTEESSAREALRNQHAAAELLLSRFDAHQAYLRQQALAVQQLAEALAKPDSEGRTMSLYIGGKRVGTATDVTIDLGRSTPEQVLRDCESCAHNKPAYISPCWSCEKESQFEPKEDTERNYRRSQKRGAP